VEIKIGLSGGFPVAGSKVLFGEAIKKATWFSFISSENKIYLSSAIKDQYKGKATQAFNSYHTIKTINNQEELFLDRLMDLFHASIFEHGSNMEKFCLQLGVSASGLYRNSTQLTGLSPNDLLNAIRLNAALELMQKQNKNTTETSLELGYTNPSYFTKCFKKKFNVLPAEFIKSLNPILAGNET
jgi:AraC-like DNA-binding protein